MRINVWQTHHKIFVSEKQLKLGVLDIFCLLNPTSLKNYCIENKRKPFVSGEEGQKLIGKRIILVNVYL
jgi:hypothetical protein